LVSERRTFLQEVATLKQCKEKLEATLLQERQRAADGLAAFEAAERRMSVEQMSSLKKGLQNFGCCKSFLVLRLSNCNSWGSS